MSSALHRAVWRNDVQQVSVLLHQDTTLTQEADLESGWTPLHTALYYGHLRIAAQLMTAGSRLDVLDHQERSPLELLTKELSAGRDARTEVFSWGSGVNYQLGTGNTNQQLSPKRIGQLSQLGVEALSASKFHSMALTRDGSVYTWGWGLGGRLGHADSKLHTENGGAQLFPRRLTALEGVHVVSVAAAKHHALAVTASGEVYSWGLNRDGRLGHPTTVGKCVTPKRIVALKGIQAVSVAATNKHSAIVSDTGRVYTWGSNVHGQLGYGTCDSASNPIPHCVEALKHKSISQLALSKRHSLALTEDGDIYSWGYKGVAPKRVLLTGSRERESLNASKQPIQFHRGFHKVKKPIAVSVAAGVAQSCCITTTGVVLTWRSDSPEGTVEEVGGKLAGKKALSLSAAKSAVAVVVSDGRVYSWEATGARNPPQPQLVPGMQQAASIAVGEKHSLALQRWSAPTELPSLDGSLSTAPSESGATGLSSHLSSSFDWADLEDEGNSFKCLQSSSKGKRESKTGGSYMHQSLQQICEKTVAEEVLDPKSALQFYQYADTIGAAYLKSYALHLIVQNLALVMHERQECFGLLPQELLKELELLYQKQVLRMNHHEKLNWWSEADEELILSSRRPSYQYSIGSVPTSPPGPSSTSDRASVAAPCGNRFMPAQKSIQKIQQTMSKKLQQIGVLFQKEARGEALDPWQRAKMARRTIYQRALDAIHSGAGYDEVQLLLAETPEVEKASGEADRKLRPVRQLSVKPQVAPNLLPVRPAIPRSREIGPLPRFLEPTQKLPTPCLDDPLPSELPVREKKWVKMNLHAQPRAQGTVIKRAQPCKETKKMSLSDFMAAPSEPPAPMKESAPAWGGVKFSPNTSFESIQEEQRNYRPGRRSHVMKPAVERRRTVSRWQLHSDVQIQSIHSIQIEEKAVQELQAFYKGATVRVKPGTARESQKPPAANR